MQVLLTAFRTNRLSWCNPPRKLSFPQHDCSQSPQRLVDLPFFQQTEGRPHVGGAGTVRKKHCSWKREDTSLESLGLDDTRRVAVLTEEESEPDHELLKIFPSRDQLRGAPEKHSSLWSIPFCDVKQVPSHGILKHVAFHPIKLSNFVHVSKKTLSSP